MNGQYDTVLTNGGTSSTTLEGTGSQFYIERGNAQTTANVNESGAFVGSQDGSGNATIAIASGIIGVVLQENAQSGQSAFGTDTIVLNGYDQSSSTLVTSGNDLNVVDATTGGTIVTVQGAGGQAGAIKAVDIQYSDGTSVNVQQYLGTTTQPSIVPVSGTSADQSFQYADGQLTIADTSSGTQVEIPFSFNTTQPVELSFADGTKADLYALLARNGLSVAVYQATPLDLSSFGIPSSVDVSGQYGSFMAGRGNDVITLAGDSSKAALGAGDSTVFVTGTAAHVQLGLGTSTINLRGSSENVVSGLGSGPSTINVSGSGALVESGDGSGNEKIVVGASANSFTLQEDGQQGDAQYGNDTLVLNGLSQNQTLSFDPSNNHMTVSDATSGQSLVIQNPFIANGYQAVKPIEFQFSDGSSLSLQQLLQQQGIETQIGGFTTVDNSGDKQKRSVDITGSNNTYTAGGGTETISDAGQFDTVTAGRGADTVSAIGSFSNLHVGGGNSTVNLSGTDNTLQVTQGFGTTGVTVDGAFNSIESMSGSGNENILVLPGASGFSLTEDQQGGSTAFGVDTLTMSGASSDQQLSFDYSTNVLNITDGVTNQQIALIGALGSGAGQSKPIEFAFANGVTESLQQLIAANGIDVSVGDYATADDTASPYNEHITVSGSNSSLSTGSGDDSITVAGSQDNVTLGNGNATVQLTGSGDTLTAAGGNATISAFGGSNNIILGVNSDGTTSIFDSASSLSVESSAGSGNATLTLQGAASALALTEDQQTAGSTFGTDTIVLNCLSTQLSVASTADNTLVLTDGTSGQRLSGLNLLSGQIVKPIELQFQTERKPRLPNSCSRSR